MRRRRLRWACEGSRPHQHLQGLAVVHRPVAVGDVVQADRAVENAARFLYLDPGAPEFFVDWDKAADGVAAMLRAEAGRNPYDKKLTELIGELSTRSQVFRQRWADHNVRYHRTGAKRLHHPAVGALELHFEAMTLASDPGLTLLVYTAAPGSPSADSLRLLASWAATQEARGSSERTARGQAPPRPHRHDVSMPPQNPPHRA